MKKHQIITYWFNDYTSRAQGILKEYRKNSVPEYYLTDTKSKKNPILLLSGISMRWGSLKHIGDFLTNLEYPVYIVPQLGSNLRMVSQCAKIVDTFLQEHNLQNVIIIGHSKGGTIGKYLLLHHNHDNRIKGVIALASPFGGTVLCRFIPNKAYREFRPESELTQSLQKNKDHNHRIISIAPNWDNHIWPQNGSYLHGAENITMNEYGHHRILFNQDLKQLLLDGIEKLAKKQV